MIPMRSLLCAAILWFAGLAKLYQHSAPADPFAGSWCSSSGIAAVSDDFLMFGHCWGCFAMLWGVLLLAFSGYSIFKKNTEQKRP